MTRTPSPLRLALFAAALIPPGLASAQAVNSAASGSASASAAATAGAASRATVAPAMAIPALTPSLGAISAPALNAAPGAAAAPSAALAAPLSPAAAPRAAAPKAAALPSRLPAAADGPTPLQEPIRPGEPSYGDPRMPGGDQLVHDGPRGRVLVPLSSFEPSAEPVDWRSTRSRSARLFDGAASRRALSDVAPVAGRESAAAAPLAKSAPAAAPAPATVPSASAAKASRGVPMALKVLLALALAFLPGVAFAAPAAAVAAGPITVASTLEILAAIRPAAAAIGAVAGAIYGMIAARPKDGSEASSGEMLSSVLRYGALGGASVFMLLDVTSMAFVGPTGAGLQPLSSAVVTAALGRTAFQGKFSDPATSSADRIVGAFPAVAAALGISLGVVAFAAPALSVTLAMGAMTVTGVATALFAALFKLGRSPLNGPALMAKGYVLQALMTGLALAVSSPYLFWIFSAMGAAGFGMVLWAMGRELLSFLPGRATPAPAPTTPPAPPTTPPGPKV